MTSIVADCSPASACYLMGMAESLPPYDMRHSFQAFMWCMTSDITGWSRDTDMSCGQLQCLWWVGGMPEDTFLPSPFSIFITCNVCIIKRRCLISLSPVVVMAKEHNWMPHPQWAWGPADRFKPPDSISSMDAFPLLMYHQRELGGIIPIVSTWKYGYE